MKQNESYQETALPQTNANTTIDSGVTALLIQIILNRKKKIKQSNFNKKKQAKAFPKNLIGGIIGNVLEWYDFAVFGFFAPVIGEQFFPNNNSLVSLLAAFSVFALAYLTRPVGGILFGHIGDRLGRKKALQLAVMMMAVPTFLIGLLPTYAQIGGVAPFLLILLRMAQGLSVGGEMIGSIAFVAETAPIKRRGYFSSFTFASCYCGIMLGSLSAVILNNAIGPEAISNWGWRLPFLMGIIIGLAGLWMRKELDETPAFEKMKTAGGFSPNPLSEAMKQVPWRIFHSSILVVLVGGGFYLLFIWWPTLLSRYIHPHVPHVLVLNTLSMMLLIGLIPLTGHLSDKWGRKPLLMYSSAAMTLVSYPLFMLASQGSIFSVLTSQLCFALIMSFFLGPIPATLVEFFPMRIRYSAMGISYNISLCIFGGSAPLLATWLIIRYHSVSAPALYLTFLSAVSFIAAYKLPEKNI